MWVGDCTTMCQPLAVVLVQRHVLRVYHGGKGSAQMHSNVPAPPRWWSHSVLSKSKAIIPFYLKHVAIFHSVLSDECGNMCGNTKRAWSACVRRRAGTMTYPVILLHDPFVRLVEA